MTVPLTIVWPTPRDGMTMPKGIFFAALAAFAFEARLFRRRFLLGSLLLLQRRALLLVALLQRLHLCLMLRLQLLTLGGARLMLGFLMLRL